MSVLKVLLLAAAVLGGTLSANGFQSKPLQGLEQFQQKEKRVEIDREDLPSRIQEDLATNYENATFVEAHKYVNEDGETTQYEVHLSRKGEKDINLVYDKDGDAASKIGGGTRDSSE